MADIERRRRRTDDRTKSSNPNAEGGEAHPHEPESDAVPTGDAFTGRDASDGRPAAERSDGRTDGERTDGQNGLGWRLSRTGSDGRTD